LPFSTTRPGHTACVSSFEQLSMPLEKEPEQGQPAPTQRDRRGRASLVQSEQTAAAAAIEAEPVEQ
jgi:hypothetical protein